MTTDSNLDDAVQARDLDMVEELEVKDGITAWEDAVFNHAIDILAERAKGYTMYDTRDRNKNGITMWEASAWLLSQKVKE